MPVALNYPGDAKDFILQCAVCLLLLVWVAAKLSAAEQGETNPAKTARRYLPELLLGAFVLLNYASVAWSGLAYVTFLAAFALGFRIVWGLLIGTVNWRGRELKLICAVIVAAGFMASVATLILYLRGEPEFDAIVIGHRNFLACFLIAPMTLVAYAVLSGKPAGLAESGWLSLGILVLAPMAYTFILCQSNGADIGLVATGLFLVGAHISRAWRARMIVALAVCAVIGIVAVALAWGHIRPRLIVSEQATRYFHAVGSLNMIRQRPLLGWGAGTFMSRYPHFRPIEGEQYGWMSQITLHPHNEYVSVATQAGLVGLALFLAALAIIFRRAWRAATGGDKWLVIGLLAATVGMAVHGLFDIQLSFWGAGTLFWTLIGVLISVGRIQFGDQRSEATGQERREDTLSPLLPISGRRTPIPAVSTRLALFAVCAVVVVLIWWEVPLQGLLGENSLTRAGEARRFGRLAEAEALYQKSIVQSRYAVDYILAYGRLGECLAESWGRQAARAGGIAKLEESARALESLRLLAPDLGIFDTELGAVYRALAEDASQTSPARARLYLERAAAMLNAQVTVRPYQSALPRRLLAESLHDLSARYLPVCIEQLRAALLVDPEDARARSLQDEYQAEAEKLRLPSSAPPHSPK